MLGYDHESFWDQTPRTLSLTFEAYSDRMIQQHNESVWQTWHGVALTRTKKLPDLRKLMTSSRDIRTRGQAEIEAQFEGLRRWVVAAGGKVQYSNESIDG